MGKFLEEFLKAFEGIWMNSFMVLGRIFWGISTDLHGECQGWMTFRCFGSLTKIVEGISIELPRNIEKKITFERIFKVSHGRFSEIVSQEISEGISG